jgi:hypothetical protein
MIESHPHQLELLDYVEDELPKERRRAVGAHVESCSACGATVAELEGARAALRAMPELELPADRRRRIEAALGSAGRERAVRASPRRLLGVLAAAATFVAVVVGVVTVTGAPDDPGVGGEAAATQAEEASEGAFDDATGGGEAGGDAAGAQEELEKSEPERSRNSAPLSATGSVASVQGPAADVAELLRGHGLDARAAGGRVVVRDARPRAVVRALEERPPGPVQVDVE